MLNKDDEKVKEVSKEIQSLTDFKSENTEIVKILDPAKKAQASDLRHTL